MARLKTLYNSAFNNKDKLTEKATTKDSNNSTPISTISKAFTHTPASAPGPLYLYTSID